MTTSAAIRPYGPGDTAALYEICLLTGDSGEDASGLYTDPRLVGEVYVGAYLALEPGLAFVVDDGAPAGYVVGARDTAAFDAACEESWWPPLREHYPRDRFPAGTPDAGLVALIHDPPPTEPDLLAAFPSHLHIDLLPRVQGRGAGRAGIDTLFAALRDAGSPGVHLGVGARNTGAIAFYERLGFATWRDFGTHRIMTYGL